MFQLRDNPIVFVHGNLKFALRLFKKKVQNHGTLVEMSKEWFGVTGEEWDRKAITKQFLKFMATKGSHHKTTDPMMLPEAKIIKELNP